jgi:hypothetical protein
LVYLAISQLLLVAFLVWDKHRDRDAFSAVLSAQNAQAAQERAMLLNDALREREALLRRDVTPDLTALIELTDRLAQRVQAPDRAVDEHTQRQPVPASPLPVDMFNDHAVWKSREELADELMAEETRG